MAKINFQQFVMPNGISGKTTTSGDVRESFADIIYCNINGIRAHNLAHKIYKSEGETDYSDDEVRLMRSVLDEYCAPRFISGFNSVMAGQTATETK